MGCIGYMSYMEFGPHVLLTEEVENVTAGVTLLLRLCYGPYLNSEPIFPSLLRCYGSREGGRGCPHAPGLTIVGDEVTRL
jgi:hypothetical protein